MALYLVYWIAMEREEGIYVIWLIRFGFPKLITLFDCFLVINCVQSDYLSVSQLAVSILILWLETITIYRDNSRPWGILRAKPGGLLADMPNSVEETRINSAN
jgi:hypothetical protein